eukprot:UN10900
MNTIDYFPMYSFWHSSGNSPHFT